MALRSDGGPCRWADEVERQAATGGALAGPSVALRGGIRDLGRPTPAAPSSPFRIDLSMWLWRRPRLRIPGRGDLAPRGQLPPILSPAARQALSGVFFIVCFPAAARTRAVCMADDGCTRACVRFFSPLVSTSQRIVCLCAAGVRRCRRKGGHVERATDPRRATHQTRRRGFMARRASRNVQQQLCRSTPRRQPRRERRPAKNVECPDIVEAERLIRV